ncbi:Uncharacterised protein [Pannonibacter phragmitetus]|uniref:Uncharacterized protein n=1 Tax=Pannonibacter phragmitetus TaxID=121719 RepID=A0A378ZV67_9HYPH|nr:Uncharacterised protein [Pannonibacter phragmitetus]
MLRRLRLGRALRPLHPALPLLVLQYPVLQQPVWLRLPARLRAGRLLPLLRQEDRGAFSLRRKQACSRQHLPSRTRQGALNQPLRHPLQVRHLRGWHRLRRARGRPQEVELPDLPHRCQRQERCPLLQLLPGRARYQVRYWVRLWASRPGPDPIRRPIREQARCQPSPSHRGRPRVWPKVRQPVRSLLHPCRPRHHPPLPQLAPPARARRELVRQSPQSRPPPDCRPERPCLPGLLPVRPLQLPHLALLRHLRWRRVLASHPRQMPVPLPQIQPQPLRQRRSQARLLPCPLLARLPAPLCRGLCLCLRPRRLRPVQVPHSHGLPCPVRRRRRSFRLWRAGRGP